MLALTFVLFLGVAKMENLKTGVFCPQQLTFRQSSMTLEKGSKRTFSPGLGELISLTLLSSLPPHIFVSCLQMLLIDTFAR